MSAMRKMWTISLPSDLEREVLRVMREEKRTRSELVRKALREYIEARELRTAEKQKAKQRFFEMVDRVRERTDNTSEEEIKQLVNEAVTAVRRKKRAG